jgi:hypothetical protein
MDVELSPEQPLEIVAAVEELLDLPATTRPDPWWQAGVDEALYGETAARPRSTLGAERA